MSGPVIEGEKDQVGMADGGIVELILQAEKDWQGFDLESTILDIEHHMFKYQVGGAFKAMAGPLSTSPVRPIEILAQSIWL